MEPNPSPATPNQEQNPNHIQSVPEASINSAPLAASATDVQLVAKSSERSAQSKPFYTQWQFYVILVLAILAVVGCAVGVYGIQVSQDALGRIAGLEDEIAEKNQLLVKYGTELGYKVDQYGNPIFGEKPAEPDPEPENTSDYIYAAEWRLKFKIPDGLEDVSYVYISANTGDDDLATSLCATGRPSEATTKLTFADLWHTGVTGLGCLTRLTSEGGESQEQNMESDDKYQYVYSGPQAFVSIDSAEQEWEIKTISLIQKLFENRSSFEVE